VVEIGGRTIIMMQNKTELLKQKKGVSLNATQSEAELACAEEEVRRLVKKGLTKYAAARGLPERGNATIVNWAQATATAALEDVFGRVVSSTPDTVTQFVVLKCEYLASAPVQAAHDLCFAAQPPLINRNSTVHQLVMLIADRVHASLLNAIAESLTGLKWPGMLQRMQMDACAAALAVKISGPPDVVRGLWRARFNAHKAVYTPQSLATDRGKRMLVKGLVDCLDPSLLLLVPGTDKLLAAVEPTGNTIADILCEAAEKVERSATKKKPATPTETSETTDSPFLGSCFRCGKAGHKKSDCPNDAKEPPEKGKRDGRSKSRGRDGQREAVRCATCGATNDHYTRKCPEQTCLSCGATGHAKIDCKPGEKKDEHKPSPSISVGAGGARGGPGPQDCCKSRRQIGGGGSRHVCGGGNGAGRARARANGRVAADECGARRRGRRVGEAERKAGCDGGWARAAVSKKRCSWCVTCREMCRRWCRLTR
jgi:hypothetical protein